MKFLIVLLLAAVPAAAQICPKNQTTLIDNFTSGLVTPQPQTGTNDILDEYQTAPGVPGGVRREYFVVSGNPFGQVGEYGIVNDPTDPSGDGALAVSSGAHQFFQIQIFYGYDLNKHFVPLHYFPPDGCDRFRFTFDSSSRGVNFNFVVETPFNGVPDGGYFKNALNMPENAEPFCVEFPFMNFRTNQFGVQEDFVHTGIDFLLPSLQSGSAMGSNDLVIKRIEVAQGRGAVNGAACIIVP
jgi:hypothetical protein